MLFVPFASFVARLSGNAERPADRVVASSRKLRQQFSGLGGRHAGRQHVGPVTQQGLENFLDRGDGFALGKDHFREAAAAMPIEVDLGVADVGDFRPAGLADEFFPGKLTGEQLGSELFEFLWLHDLRAIP